VIGSLVEAQMGGKDEWCGGEIEAVNVDGTFGVKYESGESEPSVPADMIRIKAAALAAAPVVNVDTHEHTHVEQNITNEHTHVKEEHTHVKEEHTHVKEEHTHVVHNVTIQQGDTVDPNNQRILQQCKNSYCKSLTINHCSSKQVKLESLA
jgi:hypothetical protein